MEPNKDIVIKRATRLRSLDDQTVNKMIFLYNAVDKGWTVKRKGDKYIFVKKHEGKREILHDSFLERFVEENFTFPS